MTNPIHQCDKLIYKTVELWNLRPTVCVRGRSQRSALGGVPQDGCLSIGPGAPNWVDWLVTESREPPVSTPSHVIRACCHIQLFTWVQGWNLGLHARVASTLRVELSSQIPQLSLNIIFKWTLAVNVLLNHERAHGTTAC